MAINSLKKPGVNRGISDLKFLKKFIQKISFFEEIINDKGGDIVESLCYHLGHKFLREGDIVFREGSFYLIQLLQLSCKLKRNNRVNILYYFEGICVY